MLHLKLHPALILFSSQRYPKVAIYYFHVCAYTFLVYLSQYIL